jgi:O-antigen ligase
MLPHNDYLRTYYDLGIAGLLVTGLLIAFMIRLLMRSAGAEADFILLAYLVITCFRFTDNFMYVTIPVWIYMFMGSFALRPAAGGGNGGGHGGGEPGTEEA